MKLRVIFATSLMTIILLAMSGCGATVTPGSVTTLTSRAVTVSMGARPDHLGAAETYPFTVTVANTADTSVTWTVSGCTSGCGTINSAGVYTAPSFVATPTSVTIVATAHADTTKSASASLLLRPVSLSIAVDSPGNVVPGDTRIISALVDHDPMSAGVTWTLSGAGCAGDSCGSLAGATGTSITYRAPATVPSPNLITVVATSVTDTTRQVSLTLTISGTPYLLQGSYAFLINGYRNYELEAIAGQFTVDGNGHLSGTWDANRGPTADVAQPITGTYSMGLDGHGSMLFQAGGNTYSYILSVDPAGATGRFIEVTAPPAGLYRASSGYLVRQDPTSFQLSSTEGDRVIAVYGEATYSHVAAIGHIRTGTFAPSNSVIDLNWAIDQNVARFPNSVAVDAVFTVPDPMTGRGTASLTVGTGTTATYHFAYYIGSSDRLLLVQTDARGFNGGLLIPVLSGEMRQQPGGGMDGASVFYLTGTSMFDLGEDIPMVRIGEFLPAWPQLTATYDQNVAGRYGHPAPLISLNASVNGAFSAGSEQTERISWTLTPGPIYENLPEPSVGYQVNRGLNYFMTGSAFGVFEPQTGGPFNIAQLAGKYVLNTNAPAMPFVKNIAGWMTLDANGSGLATLYINTGSGASFIQVNATATVAGNGRGTLVFSAASADIGIQNLVFWAISPDRWVAISTVNSTDAAPALLYVERTGS